MLTPVRMVNSESAPMGGCGMSFGSDDASNMLCAAPSILSSSSDLETQDVFADKFSIDRDEPVDAVERLTGSLESFAKSAIAAHRLEDTFYVMDVGVLEQLYRAWQSAMPRVEVKTRDSSLTVCPTDPT